MLCMEKFENKKAVIETGHRYALKHIGSPEDIEPEVALAESVSAFLKGKGYADIEKTVLLDEVKPQRESYHSPQNHWRWMLFIQRDFERVKSAVGDDYKVMLESMYEPQARELAEQIRNRIRNNPGNAMNARLAGDKEDRIKVGSNKKGLNISLFQNYETRIGEISSIPSCPLLDMAVYQAKLESSGLAVTILPTEFRKQQKEVQTLFNILGQEPPVIVVYFDSGTHEIVDVESWSREHDDIAREIKTNNNA